MTYVALLRSLNVGGRNVLPMARLAQIFDEAGCGRVRTYIQSGNVVFEAAALLARRIPEIVVSAVKESHGIETAVVVRSLSELTVLVHANPFLPVAKESELHVAFLASCPKAALVAGLDHETARPDEFAVIGRDVYLRCPAGIGRSKLTTAYFDAQLATTCTLRNWRTTCKLLQLAES